MLFSLFLKAKFTRFFSEVAKNLFISKVKASIYWLNMLTSN
jgi:hypothetical protein